MKRVAGCMLLVVAFVINIPLQAGIAIYGLVYAIRVFVEGDTLTGAIAIPTTAVCVGVAHFAVGLVLTRLKDRAAFLLGKTDVETSSRDQREWERKQFERGYFEGKRSILDAEVRHIKDSLGDISGTDPAGNRRKRARERG